MLKSGDQAPAFILLDRDENEVALSKLKAHKVLVYF